METNDEFQERIRREKRLTARLRLATERLEDAQRERIWAVVEAHQSGLSIRPETAARLPYTDFCGYFYVPKSQKIS